MGQPVYNPNSFKVNQNLLISYRVRVELSGHVKIASPIAWDLARTHLDPTEI